MAARIFCQEVRPVKSRFLTYSSRGPCQFDSISAPGKKRTFSLDIVDAGTVVPVRIAGDPPQDLYIEVRPDWVLPFLLLLFSSYFSPFSAVEEKSLYFLLVPLAQDILERPLNILPSEKR